MFESTFDIFMSSSFCMFCFIKVPFFYASKESLFIKTLRHLKGYVFFNESNICIFQHYLLCVDFFVIVRIFEKFAFNLSKYDEVRQISNNSVFFKAYIPYSLDLNLTLSYIKVQKIQESQTQETWRYHKIQKIEEN